MQDDSIDNFCIKPISTDLFFNVLIQEIYFSKNG